MIEIVCLQNNPNQANDFWHSQYGERGKNTQASGEIYFELTGPSSRYPFLHKPYVFN